MRPTGGPAGRQTDEQMGRSLEEEEENGSIILRS